MTDNDKRSFHLDPRFRIRDAKVVQGTLALLEKLASTIRVAFFGAKALPIHKEVSMIIRNPNNSIREVNESMQSLRGQHIPTKGLGNIK